jgi:hypothetical protein
MAFDRPGSADRPPRTDDEGEGIVRVPTDLAAFVDEPGGWGPADVFDTVDFSPTDDDIMGYFLDQSRVQAFVVPVDEVLLAPPVILYSQAFGRQTPPGSLPSAGDPAVSYRVDFGPLGPCVTAGGGCTMPPPVGRFTVTGEVPGGGAVTPTEEDSGSFRFDDQVELVVKILDACRTDDRFYVYMSGPSGGAAPITVTLLDNATGETLLLQPSELAPFGSPTGGSGTVLFCD